MSFMTATVTQALRFCARSLITSADRQIWVEISPQPPIMYKHISLHIATHGPESRQKARNFTFFFSSRVSWIRQTTTLRRKASRNDRKHTRMTLKRCSKAKQTFCNPNDCLLFGVHETFQTHFPCSRFKTSRDTEKKCVRPKPEKWFRTALRSGVIGCSTNRAFGSIHHHQMNMHDSLMICFKLRLNPLTHFESNCAVMPWRAHRIAATLKSRHRININFMLPFDCIRFNSPIVSRDKKYKT